MSSRERILAKIKKTREAKAQSIDISEAPLASGLKVPEGNLLEAFKQNLEAVDGECHFSKDKDSCIKDIEAFLEKNKICSNVYASSTMNLSFAQAKKTDGEIANISAGITACDLLAAQTGTVLLTAKEGRRLLGLSPIHIVVAEASQMRATLDEAVKEMATKYNEAMPSQMTLITGPSRTADIEKTLILGAHGPKRLVVFIYGDL